MATELLSRAEAGLDTSRRALLLVWQNPETRRFVRVGQLDVLADGRFAFHYLPGAGTDPEFFELDEYPDRNAVYVSDDLPVFFSNRIMSAERPSYGQYLRWLGVEEVESAQLPIEVLARTGGQRVTDTFHIVDLPEQFGKSFSSRFFVSGIRYTQDADEVLASVSDGTQLSLELDESNPVNPKAVLVDTADGRKVGYVPDWLCGDVHDLIRSGWAISAVAEQVNPDAPAHVRVLCRIEAQRR
jgi:hypothetical protein